jgi:cytoskeletal protein CcmA (bactofilin family)
MLSNFTAKKPEKHGPAMSAASMPAKRPGPGAGALSQERRAPSVIARDLVILGNLVCKGEVQVEGEVQGDIHGATIVIGEHGRIMGGIVAGEVVVRGQVMGSIRGKKVVLQPSSHVEGDIFHQSLAIEPGAYFEGKSRRCEDPTAGIERPGAAAMHARGAPSQPGVARAGPIPIPPASDA